MEIDAAARISRANLAVNLDRALEVFWILVANLSPLRVLLMWTHPTGGLRRTGETRALDETDAFRSTHRDVQ